MSARTIQSPTAATVGSKSCFFAPGEAIELALEPKNPADTTAVAVFSGRGVQIGYLTADRAPRIASMVRSGREIRVAFRQAAQHDAAIRVAFDGEAPVLPAASPSQMQPSTYSDEPDFWPDYVPPDE